MRSQTDPFAERADPLAECLTHDTNFCRVGNGIFLFGISSDFFRVIF